MMTAPIPASAFDGPKPDRLWRLNGMEWAQPLFSRVQINTAAKIMISGDPEWDTYVNDEGGLKSWVAYWDARGAVDNWRSSHNYPLNTFKVTLRRKAIETDPAAIVAQRIKRMSSIEAKLKRFPTMRMCQMQDLGGCRAILKSVNAVRTLMKRYEESDLKHELDDIDDYLTNPKSSGYRGVHLIWKYYSDKKVPSVYNGLFIEMQLRSHRQHAWATAVETVGTFLRQSLKASQGEDRWLRFFALMGSVIARSERSTHLVPNTPIKKSELLAEVKDAAEKLNVVYTLNRYAQALNIASEGGVLPGFHYYLLQLMPQEERMVVHAFARQELEEASRRYTEVEKEIASKPGAEAVLVSVDSMKSLQRAYPNYFLDTGAFVSEVTAAINRA
jgi:hypothetical protein